MLIRHCFALEFARNSNNRKADIAEQNEKEKTGLLSLAIQLLPALSKSTFRPSLTATYHFL